MIKTILLQADATGGNYTQFIMLAGMIAIFYFFFIRPQQKKQKDQKKFIGEIKKGDQVVTLGGIHGKVASVDESTITLDVDRGNKLVVEKSSISLEASKRVSGEK
ncbi:MAG: preprotein translocase subunit YajC [Marinoscillum sp.]